MSFEQFGRRWRITIGSIQTDDLDVRFTINRSLWAIGTAEVEIFNLSKDHRDQIYNEHLAATSEFNSDRRSITDNLRRNGPLVRIEAGYAAAGSMSALFQGNERTTRIFRDGTDIITKLTAGDGQYSIRTRRASTSFGRDTQLVDVLEYLAGQIDVGTGNLREAIADAHLDQIGTTLGSAFPHGTVVRGNAARELTRLLHSAGFSWSVQDGVLQVLPIRGALERRAVLLSSSTGMLGVPERQKHNIVQVSALIQPALVPGQQAKIESENVNGIYRIEAGKYSGESAGDAWNADLTCRLIPVGAR